MLPEVDIDPLSNSRSQVKARWSYSLEKGLDGAKLPWMGTGFTNWPFGFPKPFALKAIEELTIGNCTDLISLCKLDPGTRWWKTITWFDPVNPPSRILAYPPDMWLFHKRVQYDEHPDVIEKRRLDRIAKAIEDGDEDLEEIDGDSTTNFVSVILHRRLPDAPRLKLEDVAVLWQQPR
jgi:hypothetical protein